MSDNETCTTCGRAHVELTRPDVPPKPASAACPHCGTEHEGVAFACANDAVPPRDRRPTTIDPRAIVRPSVLIGRGVAIWAYATIHESVTLGDGVSVGELTYIGRGTTVGEGTRISAQCHITDHMVIGRNVFIGPMVVTVNDKHPKANNPAYVRDSPTIEDDVSIGGNATILPGVTLGRGCVVGAGAVVTRDVAPYTTVVGVPARVKHQVDQSAPVAVTWPPTKFPGWVAPGSQW